MGRCMVGRTHPIANNEQDATLVTLQSLPRHIQPSEKEHAWQTPYANVERVP
jgi:hypothetical protein